MTKVLVIDAGLGNLGSVCAAFDRLGVTNTRLTSPPQESAASSLFSHLLLPGVGSFQAGMASLEEHGWIQWIHNSWVPSRRPMLGICLGMQLLATSGYEGSSSCVPVPGLDLISGEVIRLDVPSGVVLPHVGWNSISWNIPDLPITKGVINGGDLYFVHSYTFRPKHPFHTVAACHYGSSFTALVGDPAHNIWGMQFHPEKSQKLGRQLLQNFLDLEAC